MGSTNCSCPVIWKYEARYGMAPLGRADPRVLLITVKMPTRRITIFLRYRRRSAMALQKAKYSYH